MPYLPRNGQVRGGVAETEIHIDLFPYRKRARRFEEEAVKTDVADLADTSMIAMGIFQARPVGHPDGLSAFLAREMMGWLRIHIRNPVLL